MMCKRPDISEKLVLYTENIVSSDERREIETHIKECESCREEVEILRTHIGIIKQSTMQKSLSECLEDDILVNYSESPHGIPLDQRWKIEKHLRYCEECRKTLALLKELNTDLGTSEDMYTVRVKIPAYMKKAVENIYGRQEAVSKGFLEKIVQILSQRPRYSLISALAVVLLLVGILSMIFTEMGYKRGMGIRTTSVTAPEKVGMQERDTKGVEKEKIEQLMSQDKRIDFGSGKVEEKNLKYTADRRKNEMNHESGCAYKRGATTGIDSAGSYQVSETNTLAASGPAIIQEKQGGAEDNNGKIKSHSINISARESASHEVGKLNEKVGMKDDAFAVKSLKDESSSKKVAEYYYEPRSAKPSSELEVSKKQIFPENSPTEPQGAPAREEIAVPSTKMAYLNQINGELENQLRKRVQTLISEELGDNGAEVKVRVIREEKNKGLIIKKVEIVIKSRKMLDSVKKKEIAEKISREIGLKDNRDKLEIQAPAATY